MCETSSFATLLCRLWRLINPSQKALRNKRSAKLPVSQYHSIAFGDKLNFLQLHFRCAKLPVSQHYYVAFGDLSNLPEKLCETSSFAVTFYRLRR
jgi:hypothetical protein